MAIDFSQVKDISFNYYGQLEYVENSASSSGAGFHVGNLNVYQLNVEITFEVLNTVVSSYKGIFGSISPQGQYAPRIFGLVLNSDGVIEACAGTYSLIDHPDDWHKPLITSPNGIYTVKTYNSTPNSDIVTFEAYKDSVLINTVTIDADILTGVSTYHALSNLYDHEDAYVASKACNCRIYEYKVFTDETHETLRYNYVPSRLADGTIAMYDTLAESSAAAWYPPAISGGRWIAPITGISQYAHVKQIKNANDVVLWTPWVPPVQLTSITLSGYNTSLNQNSSFIYGGTVTANYSDGTTADVTLDTTFSGYDMSTPGTQTVTASYTEGGITKTATYQLTVVAVPVLTSITLAGYNTSLNQNSNFIYGGTVTANYSTGSTADVTTSTTFTGYNMSTAGTYTVTASYTEDGVTKTATYQLTVVASPDWHTIWSGSKEIKLSNGTVSGATNNFTHTTARTGNRPKVRITVTTANTGSGTKEYALNGSSSYYTYSSSSISNPYTVTLANASSTHIISLKNNYNGYSIYLKLMKDYDSTNDYVKFSLTSSGDTRNANGYVDIKVTKIEQYY